MPVSLAEFAKGYEFPAAEFELSREWIAQYAAAAGDEAIGALGAEAVPPMAVAALAIRALLEHSSLPPGTIHAGQELAFARAPRVGDILTVRASVVSRGERAEWVLMGVALDVEAGGEPVMRGRATVTFPSVEAP